MLLYLIWATKPTATNANYKQNPSYDSPEAIEACRKNLACFADRWDDAVSYFKIFEFLHQKVSWTIDTSAPSAAMPSLEEAESHLEQLKKKYLHQAILGMIEDMMYGGFVRYETTLDNFVTGVL